MRLPHPAFIRHFDRTDMIQDTRPYKLKHRNLTSDVAITDWDDQSIAAMARLRLTMRPRIGMAMGPVDGASSEAPALVIALSAV